MSKLSELVKQYCKEIQPIEEADLLAYKNCKNLNYLLKRAVVGLTHDGKRDSHKKRRTHDTFRNVYFYLDKRKEDIKRCETFDEIMQIVYECRQEGYGYNFNSLSIYDTAICIGVYFDLLPDKVFLHRGALVGAINLLGKDTVKKRQKLFMNDKDFPYLEVEDFPTEVRKLKPHHIENFLCRFRNEFINK